MTLTRDTHTRPPARETSFPQIHVCSLSKIADGVRATGASSMVTLINKDTPVERPPEIAPERHLFVSMSDIVVAAEGHILPAEAHLADLLAFVRAWDQRQPLVIHCYAGVSRSTAAAYIAACALREDRCVFALARALRARSPTATPNAMMIALADRMLGRHGRMIEAVRTIGRGAECFEGVPFAFDLTAAEGTA